MGDPVQTFLKSMHTASKSQIDKQVGLDVLNHALGSALNANEMFDQLFQTLLAMFADYEIFGNRTDIISPMIKERMWTTTARHIERFIIANNFPKDSIESPIRRGLIQVFLYHFAFHYLKRSRYTYKYIRRNFVILKNLNRLQKDRELVFSELLTRLEAQNKVGNQMASRAEIIIQRDKLMQDVGDLLCEHSYLMLIGPQGMGKSTTLSLLLEYFRSEQQVYTYQFTARDQISHPDYFTDQMLSFFNGDKTLAGKRNTSLFLLDDIHLLPPALQQVFRNRILPEVFNNNRLSQTQIKVIAASAFELDALMEYHPDLPRLMSYHLIPFDLAEVESLWQNSPSRSSYSPQEIFQATRGYPALVGQMTRSGATFDNSLWFNAIFNAINWDESITQIMKALCTFRYIGPFLMSDLAKFINDPYRMQQVWHIPQSSLDPTEAHLLWEKLVYRNAFVQRVSHNHKEFPMDKNFAIARVLRQLAENAINTDQPVLFEQRHKLAAEYYYSEIINPLIPGSKKPVLIIEYLYHLAKQNLSGIQILSIGSDLTELAKSKEKPADRIHYTKTLLKYFSQDDELRDVMGEELFNKIIETVQGELTV